MAVSAQTENATKDTDVLGEHAPGPDIDVAQKDNAEDEMKRRYLTLLTQEELVGLVMNLDRDRSAPIFPGDLPNCVALLHSLRPSVFRPIAPPAHTSSQAPEGTQSEGSRSPQPPLGSPGSLERPGNHPGPSHIPFPHAIPPIHSFQFHFGGPPPLPLPPQSQSATKLATPQTIDTPSPAPGRAAPPRDLQRNQQASSSSSSSAVPPNSSWDNGMPSYEEMICMALADLANPDGSAPKALFEWMLGRFPLMTNFRPSAHQALQKAFKRGRLTKNGSKYLLNPAWGGGSTSRRTTRRPQAAGGAAPPILPFPIPGVSWPSAAPGPPIAPPAISQPSVSQPPIPPSPVRQRHAGDYDTVQSAEVLPAAALLEAIAGINGIIGDDTGNTAPAAVKVVAAPSAQEEETDDDDGEDELLEDDEDDEDEAEGPTDALKSSFATLAAQLKIAAASSSS